MPFLPLLAFLAVGYWAGRRSVAAPDCPKPLCAVTLDVRLSPGPSDPPLVRVPVGATIVADFPDASSTDAMTLVPQGEGIFKAIKPGTAMLTAIKPSTVKPTPAENIYSVTVVIS
jgi:hypothetical protein